DVRRRGNYALLIELCVCRHVEFRVHAAVRGERGHRAVDGEIATAEAEVAADGGSSTGEARFGPSAAEHYVQPGLERADVGCERPAARRSNAQGTEPECR